jgi:outer membrane immunogenic protein
MRTKLWGRISVLASMVAAAGVANAADMAVKAPVYKAPPPIIIPSWAGFYIGVHGGGGWADNKFNVFGRDNGTGSGGFGGGHVGYNWQFGSVVAGVEGDFDGAALSYTDVDRFKHTTDELASARARLGYAVIPNLLAYGTGGFGWAHSKIDSGPFAAPGDSVSQPGWVAGAGLEYKIFGPLIARGEYLHYGLGSQSINAGSAFGADTLKESIDVVRGGLSYKF